MRLRTALTRRALLWLVCCLLGSLVLSSECRAAADEKLDLSVMSFNIRYGTADDGADHWKNRREMVFDVLRKHKSDIIGLQEALRFQIDEIKESVEGFGETGVGREDGKTKSEYCAILYAAERFKIAESGTFWFSDTPEVPGSIHWGNACTRICTWARFVERKSGKTFYFYNLHLDHISQPSREKSAVLLSRRIQKRSHPDPFVVTGDFNAGEGNSVVKYLKGEALLAGADGVEVKSAVPVVDTFRVLYPDAKDVGTFNGFKGQRSGGKIDFILTTSDVEVLDARILYDNVDGRYPSDHYPVSARMKLAVRASR